MLIVQEEIKKRGLVSPTNEIRVKNSSCDLTIGRIIPTGSADDKLDGRFIQEFLLQPNHMVFVISLQKVTLPADVTGIATLVTSLTKEGILCLNTGVVDPGYNGYLGATLVNFSNQTRKISLNQRLFRVLFLSHEAIPDEKLEKLEYSKNEYEFDALSKNRAEFSQTFLDVKGVQEMAERYALNYLVSHLVANWVPWLALLVAFASMLGFGIGKE